jgi:ketosteroid isomerase-like protein
MGQALHEGRNGVQGALTAWVGAELNGEADRLDDLLTDDFVGIGPLGFLLSKREWLARYEHNDFRYEAFRLEETQTRAYGDSAVVTAHQIGQGVLRGSQVPFTDLRATLVFVNQSGHWRLSTVHTNFIAGTPGAPPIPVPAQGQPR